MGVEQRIDQFVDLVQIKLGGGMGIKHRCMMDMLAFARHQSLDHAGLDVDVGLDQRRQMDWHSTDGNRPNAVAIDEARNLDDTVGRQVLDQRAIDDVAIDH